MNKIISKLTSGVLLCTMLTYTTPLFAFTKDETVYSKLDSNGNVYNTIVSDHIKNTEQSDLINDVSDLLNLRNAGGDEAFDKDETKLVWHSNGEDIYYQGESDKQLPIKCEIKYELNGEEISSSDIAGKSGKVKIRLTYTNIDSHIMNINGTNETLYTPFVVVCGTIINNDNNKNIEIKNGKAIDDGNKTILVGLSLPGLQESLNISKDVLEFPNTIEISMDSTNFEMNNIMSYATSKVIEDKDLSLLENLDKIYNQVNTLQSASKQLESGSTLLKDSSITYSSKSKEFNSALKQVSNGVNSANSSYSEINNAINLINNSSSNLQSGAKTISDGTEAISSNLSFISEKLKDLQSGASSLKSGKDSLTAGISTFMSSVNNINLSNQSAEIAKLQQLINSNTSLRDSLISQNASLNNKLSLGGMTPEEENTIRTQLTSNNSLITLLNSNIDANNSTLTLLKASDISSMQQLQAGLTSLQTGLQAFDSGIDSLYTGAGQLQGGISMLANKSAELSKGAETLYNGTLQLSSGTKTLSVASSEMKKGLNTLDYSSTQLVSANNKLTDGADALATGVGTLADGISIFNKDGIKKICNYINGDLKDISVRLDKLQVLSEKYNNFSMLENGNEGIVKFIMIVDSVKKENQKKQEMIVENKENDE